MRRNRCRQLPLFAWMVGSVVRPLVGRHRTIGEGRGVLASEFPRQRTRGSAQDLSDGSETRPSG
jgi:hypothetical protein